MFAGRVVHELYFDLSKLLFFTREEKIGALVSAFIIASLAHEADVPLSDQTTRTHAELIIRYAKRLKYGAEVSAFLRRFMALEDGIFVWDTFEEHLEKSYQSQDSKKN
jgi:hypothetical protein